MSPRPVLLAAAVAPPGGRLCSKAGLWGMARAPGAGPSIPSCQQNPLTILLGQAGGTSSNLEPCSRPQPCQVRETRARAAADTPDHPVREGWAPLRLLGPDSEETLPRHHLYCFQLKIGSQFLKNGQKGARGGSVRVPCCCFTAISETDLSY